MSVPFSPNPGVDGYSSMADANPEHPSTTIPNHDRSKYRWTHELDVVVMSRVALDQTPCIVQ